LHTTVTTAIFASSEIDFALRTDPLASQIVRETPSGGVFEDVGEPWGCGIRWLGDGKNPAISTVFPAGCFLRRNSTMLVLSRKVGEKIFIGDNISVTIVRVAQGIVRIGVDAPADLPIVREEIKERLRVQAEPSSSDE
jgi:carbon storage regulator